MRWPVSSEQHQYINFRVKQNRNQYVPAEEWAFQKLRKCGRKVIRNYAWGLRIFDFWFPKLRCAVEIDGNTHNPDYDSYRDNDNLKRDGIIVYRIKNYDEVALERVVNEIKQLTAYKERRLPKVILPTISKKQLLGIGLSQACKFLLEIYKDKPEILEFLKRMEKLADRGKLPTDRQFTWLWKMYNHQNRKQSKLTLLNESNLSARNTAWVPPEI